MKQGPGSNGQTLPPLDCENGIDSPDEDEEDGSPAERDESMDSLVKQETTPPSSNQTPGPQPIDMAANIPMVNASAPQPLNNNTPPASLTPTSYPDQSLYMPAYSMPSGHAGYMPQYGWYGHQTAQHQGQPQLLTWASSLFSPKYFLYGWEQSCTDLVNGFLYCWEMNVFIYFLFLAVAREVPYSCIDMFHFRLIIRVAHHLYLPPRMLSLLILYTDIIPNRMALRFYYKYFLFSHDSSVGGGYCSFSSHGKVFRRIFHHGHTMVEKKLLLLRVAMQSLSLWVSGGFKDINLLVELSEQLPCLNG